MKKMQIKGGKIHIEGRLLYPWGFDYMCGLGSFRADTPTNKKATCKHCLKAWEKSKI